MVRSANDPMKKTPSNKGGGGSDRTGKAVGDALREAYDEAIGEAIPAEMLDLLKKLD
ncbi:NepR family anti-sigma factor [Sphingomonas sp. AOB5]|uniref:NepR family anti-sigma factor n=1 Tax=Sphingomonas sp. AOB5 TaxID=3034017 RepID=UPI0023F7B49B|nr:NepR family anti-sigma factor [Sphingomonas sp. AOB5]MDF7775749.1 NepR family anti-sigma factor [Sphingomonas sp. AOB5]